MLYKSSIFAEQKMNIIQFIIHLGLSLDFLTFELSIWF